MPPTRLLVFSPSAYPLGGVATWLDGLARGLEERGWSVALALPEGRTFVLEDYLARHPWPRVHRLRNREGTESGRRRGVRSLLSKGGFDLALGVNFPELYAVAAELGERGGERVRVAAALHGLVPGILADFARFRGVLTAVIASSRLACAAVERWSGIDSRRVFHAAYGTNVLPVEPSTAGPEGGCADLVFAGRLEQGQKRALDLSVLTRSLDRLGVPWTLEIAGSGPEEEALKLAFDGDLRVTFVDDLPAEEIRSRVFRPGRILVLTSSWETGPIVAWEAMERGMLLVSSDYLGLRAEGLLEDGENCLLFPVGDLDTAAERIGLAVREGERFAEIVAAGRRLIETRCSAAASSDAWDGALRAALELPLADGPCEVPRAAPGGRLERWLGERAGSGVRRLLGRAGIARGPGDEWPHTFGGGASWEQMEAELVEHESSLARERSE